MKHNDDLLETFIVYIRDHSPEHIRDRLRVPLEACFPLEQPEADVLEALARSWAGAGVATNAATVGRRAGYSRWQTGTCLRTLEAARYAIQSGGLWRITWRGARHLDWAPAQIQTLPFPELFAAVVQGRHTADEPLLLNAKECSILLALHQVWFESRKPANQAMLSKKSRIQPPFIHGLARTLAAAGYASQVRRSTWAITEAGRAYNHVHQSYAS